MPDSSPPSYSPEALLDAALLLPGLPGATEFEAKRAELLARAKAEPLFFIRTPEFDAEVSDTVRYYRHRLSSTEYPWDVLAQLLPHFSNRPDEGRQTLLREGYLYTVSPELAYALVSLVQVEHLFDAEQVWIARGEHLMHAKRASNGSYVYTEGPHEGSRVRLLHLDRIGTGEPPAALHRDFRALAYRLAFDRVRIRHISQTRIVADLRYGAGLWVPTVLRAEGPTVALETELVTEAQARELSRRRQAAKRRMRSMQWLRYSILQQVAEALPFDEPKNESGQEDGKLRRSWRWVYSQNRESFAVRTDEYPVFDSQGRPLVPQVCIDFLLDTFERASGTWYRARGEPPGKLRGGLDFDELVPRWQLRRTQRFVEFASARRDWFDVLRIADVDRVKGRHESQYFRFLEDHADDFRQGDAVLIQGKTPWDSEKEHYHSFFVYETDPMSGMPILIAGNAGVPSLWSWETERRRTPRRSIMFRIRPKAALLRLIDDHQRDAPIPTPPPLLDREAVLEKQSS